MSGGKAIDKNFPDPNGRRGVPAEVWDGDPDDRPLTPSEKPVYEADELEDWQADIRASWQSPA
jgi:hypothetical protein